MSHATADADYGPFNGHPMDPRTPNDDTAHDMAMDAFWVAVEKGDDKCLPLDNRGRTSASVSQLLIDPLLTNTDLIFSACYAAVNGDAAMAAVYLRRLVEHVGIEYAQDHSGAWA